VSDINTSVDQQIADVNKALTAGDSALKSQLQTVENGLKQSIAQANTGWDKAVKQETADRIADVNAKAAQAADQLLNEKNERLASIDNLQTIIQDGDESLARQIAEISAGSGQQFDSFSIWYFDKDNEGWTEDDAGQVPMQITDEGWLKASNSTASCRSPNGQKIPGSSYRTVMLRIKRVGNPAWKGRLYWIGTEETGWSDARSVTIAEQEFDGEGISVVAISDVNWNASGTVRRFRLDLAQGQNADNYFLIHWISVGRPAPAASTAALRNEEMARTQADEVEALKRSTLAAQIRGTSDSNSLADLRSGLLYQEMNARITADKAEVTARESLQTQFNDNKSSVAEELSSLSTTQSAQASKISGLETSLGKKADATALQSLTQKVEQQGTTLTSQGNTLTSLSNRVGKTESGVAANSNAITGLQSTVSQQEDKLISQGLSLTKLTNDLSATNANVNKKADASALQTLQNTITQQGGTLTTQGSAIVSLENSLNALDVGGANQIPDSGSLIRYGNVSTDKYNGNGVMAFTLKAGAAYRDLISINLSAPVDGTEYVLSFYAKAAINGQKVRSHFYSPNSTKKAVSSQGNTFTNSDGLCDFTLTTEWQRYWVKWTQGAGTGSKKLIVARIQQGSTDQTVYLSSPKFERGNVPTAWSEAPEDNASAAAVSALTSRVDSAEGVLTSQGQLLTSLQNGLTTADQNIGKKADSSAVNTLTNRVSQVENTLTTQSESITSLSGSISTLRNQVSNPWFDGSLESYADGQQISGSGAIVTTAQKFNGSRSLRLRREANNGGNSDKQIGPWSSIRENAVYSVELWAMMPADQSPSTGWQTIVGIQGQNAAGQNSWQGAVTITESGLGERGKWMKFSGKARMNGTGRTRGVVWISTRGATGSGTPGYDLYIDDIVITDVTDAQTALDVADASTTAVSGLTTRVTNAEAKITAHSQQITSLQSSLSGKADAEAVNTLSSRVTSAEGKIESTASGLTSLNSTVGSLSSTVQAQGQTLSDTNGKVNSTYSIKVETNNGKKVGAGIVLGSDGSTSDMILYADRFSLFNRNSKAAVPVMIAEGNELYIDSARIKNGTIDIAKITDRLSSTNYVAGWRGWSITKSGSSEFNNVVVRGEIQADTGTLNNVVINESCNILGTVRANKIIGDVGSWAINIAQHRSRRIAKAQWAWFDLLAVDRQPFEQRVQLLGALRQDDSINITGGGKLTAGMEYRSYEGGSLSMGKLGYCILMLGTGATSGGGPMTCALSIDGVLYKQENESMEIQSMDFIVPPGTGQTVVRYGYYLDRNGGMTGVILSRFHAFVMRNSNIIRGVSSD